MRKIKDNTSNITVLFSSDYNHTDMSSNLAYLLTHCLKISGIRNHIYYVIIYKINIHTLTGNRSILYSVIFWCFIFQNILIRNYLCIIIENPVKLICRNLLIRIQVYIVFIRLARIHYDFKPQSLTYFQIHSIGHKPVNDTVYLTVKCTCIFY